MKRTKAWWAKYSQEERWFIWFFERNQNKYYYNDGYLPDDCSECQICGYPCLGYGPCQDCLNKYITLIEKEASDVSI